MKIKLERLYSKPYYVIYKNGIRDAHAMGYEQAKNIIEEARKRGEKIELDDSVLEEHNKLIELINKNK